MAAPKKIDPIEKYDYLFKWIDSDFTRNLLDSGLLNDLTFDGEDINSEIRSEVEKVKNSLLKQTTDDKGLSEDVKKSLNGLKKVMNNAVRKVREREDCAYGEKLSLPSMKGFFKHGLSLIDYAEKTADSELGSFNTYGNEYLTEDFGVGDIDFNNPDSTPKSLADIDKQLSILGYDKYWRALADRIDIDYRINSEVISDEEFEDVRDDVKDANDALRRAVSELDKKLSDRDNHRILFKDYDKTFTNTEKAKRRAADKLLYEQNSALERGWNPLRIDDLQLLKVARDRTSETINDENKGTPLHYITDKRIR